MKKLENLTWKMTGELPEHIENKLDEKDKIYYQKYNQLINRYSKTISESDFNLTKDYAPVKDIIIEVRALEDIKNGEARPSDANTGADRLSTINLKMRISGNSTMYNLTCKRA